MSMTSRITMFGAAVACAALLGAPGSALAQHDGAGHGDHAGGHGEKPINVNCPVAKEPIDASVKPIEYKGKSIGLCCAGCGDKFLAWDESKRDEFVLLAVAGKEMVEPDAKVESAGRIGDPYTLSTCSVSGEDLGSMDDMIVKVYDGREVRFCCDGCVEKFEADTAAGFKKIDAQIIASQMPYYPLETCVVSGEEFGGDMGEPIEFVTNNRLVRLCCKMCKGEFKDDPDAYLAKLDKAVADAQRDDYPLSTCVVGGGELGSMGDPVEVVVSNRLVKFCCAGCKPDFEANPGPYLAQLDAAWNAKGMFMPGEHAEHDGKESDGGGHGDGHDGHDH